MKAKVPFTIKKKAEDDGHSSNSSSNSNDRPLNSTSTQKGNESAISSSKQPEADRDIEQVVAEIPLFKRISFKFVRLTYVLLLLGQVAFLLSDYYQLVAVYMDNGGKEGLVTFGIFLFLLYVLGMRFFSYFIPKCKNIVYLVILFLLPSVIIEIASESYWEEAKNFDSFYGWYYNYTRGVEAFIKKDYRASAILFKTSVMDLDWRNDESKRPLYFKSKIYLLRLEQLISKDKKQVLANFLDTYKNIDKTPSWDRLLLVEGIINLYTEFNACNEAASYFDTCFELLNNLSNKPTDSVVYYSCSYQKLICDIKTANESTAADEWNDILNRFKSLGTYYESEFSKPAKSEEALTKLMQINNLLYEKGKIEAVLDSYLSVLNLIRNSKFRSELKFTYGRLKEIYYKINKKTEGDIYQRIYDKFEEEPAH